MDQPVPAGGVDALLNKSKGNGLQSRLTPEMGKAMIAELAKDKWRTARDAWNRLGSKFDLGNMKEPTIYKTWERARGGSKRPALAIHKKDPGAEAAFRVTLADQMEKFDLPAAPPGPAMGL